MTPIATRRLLLFSVVWSLCTISILTLNSIAGSWIPMSQNVLIAFSAITLIALAAGVIFLIRLTRLFLNVYTNRSK